MKFNENCRNLITNSIENNGDLNLIVSSEGLQEYTSLPTDPHRNLNTLAAEIQNHFSGTLGARLGVVYFLCRLFQIINQGAFFHIDILNLNQSALLLYIRIFNE